MVYVIKPSRPEKILSHTGAGFYYRIQWTVPPFLNARRGGAETISFASHTRAAPSHLMMDAPGKLHRVRWQRFWCSHVQFITGWQDKVKEREREIKHNQSQSFNWCSTQWRQLFRGGRVTPASIGLRTQYRANDSLNPFPISSLF